MAKLKAPLMSLGASGKLAGTLVFSTWKGLKTAREYVTPSNPQTAAQTTQRGLFTDAVSAWRNYYTDADMRTAWNRAATAEGRAESGFNNFMRACTKITASDADASFAYDFAAAAGNTVDFAMKNADDGNPGDEAGNFEVWVGTNADNLLYLETKTIAAGSISTSDLGDVDDVLYVQLRKDSESRSGVCKVTLIA